MAYRFRILLAGQIHVPFSRLAFASPFPMTALPGKKGNITDAGLDLYSSYLEYVFWASYLFFI